MLKFEVNTCQPVYPCLWIKAVHVEMPASVDVWIRPSVRFIAYIEKVIHAKLYPDIFQDRAGGVKAHHEIVKSIVAEAAVYIRGVVEVLFA